MTYHDIVVFNVQLAAKFILMDVDSCVSPVSSPSMATSLSSKSVNGLSHWLEDGGIPEKFCEVFTGKLAKFCLQALAIATLINSY